MYKVVVLWSGGFDSTGLLLWTLKQNYEVYPLFLNRHQNNYIWEKKAVDLLYSEIKKNYPKFILKEVRIFEIISPPLELKKEFGEKNVKFTHFLRNSDLINNAVRLALCIDANNVFIGSTVDDEMDQNFPDTSLTYYEEKKKEVNVALERMGNNRKININAPFLEKRWDKQEILKFLKDNFENIDLKLTRSCFSKNEIPCGECSACIERNELHLG